MVIANPEVLEAMTTSGGVAASICASTRRLSAASSGQFSCTTSAPPTASASVRQNVSRSGLAPGRSPSRSSTGQAESRMRSRPSRAPAPGSCTSTSKPIRR
jgi:hypothetical protein